MSRNQKWIPAGSVNVDSGMIMIGDPCYVAADDHPDHIIHNWEKFVEWLHKNGSNWKTREMDTGVIVSSGYGDGTYPVEISMKDGRVCQARITFIE